MITYNSTLALTASTAFASCKPFASQVTGYFEAPASPPASFVYGASPPPAIVSCVRGLGPPPRGAVTGTCNTFVGPDPEVLFFAKSNATGGTLNSAQAISTCAGHGAWDAVAYRCAPCDPGWALRDTGVSVPSGNTAVLCDACAPFFGPKPGSNSPPPYCTSVYTPNDQGVDALCGGRGAVSPNSGGQCACFANRTTRVVSARFSTLVYANQLGSQVLVPQNPAPVSAISC